MTDGASHTGPHAKERAYVPRVNLAHLGRVDGQDGGLESGGHGVGAVHDDGPASCPVLPSLGFLLFSVSLPLSRSPALTWLLPLPRPAQDKGVLISSAMTVERWLGLDSNARTAVIWGTMVPGRGGTGKLVDER